ncbi:MAG: hypothetical protein KIS81_00470 [Maricaulaceae bacterium]|nr:hypothetical protein [Maricaulaceae bacterium]
MTVHQPLPKPGARDRRLVILVSEEEKIRIEKLASKAGVSAGAFMRERAFAPEEEAHVQLTDEQARMLESLAEHASAALGRANAMLDEAFAEVEKTRAYFAAKKGAEA